MKLKEIFYGLGLKPRPEEYSFEVESFALAQEGEINFARWKHPKEAPKRFSQKGVNAIRGFLGEGDVAIDIGAHTGDTALPLALAVGCKGSVFALEPNPYAFKILQANSALNPKKTHIIPLMFAATQEDGEYEFEYSDSGFCNGGMHPGVARWRHAHFFKLKVAGKNLLNYLRAKFPEELKKVRYIKIDTEGADRAVAGSLKELLIQNRPYVKSEIYRHMPEVERRSYYRELRDLGYVVHKFRGDEDYAGEELTELQMIHWEHFDIFCTPQNGPVCSPASCAA
jgi:FkbM family methyltransferase